MRSKHRSVGGRGGQSGQGLVEFAISAVTFLILVFAVIDFSYLFLVKLALQNAARQAGRYAITGRAIPGQSRYNSILLTAEDTSMGIASSSNITICSTSGGCGNAGGPGDTVTVTITFPYRFITPLLSTAFPNGYYTIGVSTSFKNEPFPPSQS
jgi:Flp pilus assembly protein TadG